MQNKPLSVSISQVLKLSDSIDEYPLGTDIVTGSAQGGDALSNSKILRMLNHPMRFDGLMIFFVGKGDFTIEVNLGSYAVKDRSLIVITPGNIIRLPEVEKKKIASTELIFVLLSQDYYSSLHLDFSKVFQDSIAILANPCITLTEKQLSLATSYYNLLRAILSSDVKDKRQVIGGLISSLTYLTDDIWTGKIDAAKQSGAIPAPSHRSKQIFDNFISLVTEYHSSERGMQFYADQLCLTPKYLSKVVKEASGKSGPEWIDSFVVLEAKNMLRYSGMSIKEVVFQLNFHNQSVFNKFFKSHTGMTPTQYRRGE